MKVLCIKDTIGFQEWLTYDIYVTQEALRDPIYWIESDMKKRITDYKDYPEYFQEVKDEPVNEWKVWDMVVADGRVCAIITAIVRHISEEWDTLRYCTGYDEYKTEELREPTVKELNIYFK